MSVRFVCEGQRKEDRKIEGGREREREREREIKQKTVNYISIFFSIFLCTLSLEVD